VIRKNKNEKARVGPNVKQLISRPMILYILLSTESNQSVNQSMTGSLETKDLRRPTRTSSHVTWDVAGISISESSSQRVLSEHPLYLLRADKALSTIPVTWFKSRCFGHVQVRRKSLTFWLLTVSRQSSTFFEWSKICTRTMSF
jgi:hypothetical protein